MLTQSLTHPLTRPLTSAVTEGGGGGFSPLSLFAGGVQGVWYDPSDFASMYQDSAGTTPITAAGQSVGLLKDKSGNGWHLSQGTSARRPILRQDATGGYYLEGDGTLKFMQAAAGSVSAMKFMHDGTGGSLVLIAGFEDSPLAGTVRKLFSTNDVGTTTAGFGVQLTTTAGGLGASLLRIGNGTTSVINNGSFDGDFRTDGIAMHLVSTYKTQTGADCHNYIDGAQSNPFGENEANAPTSADANAALILFTVSAASYFRGKFYGAILRAGEFTDAQRQMVSRYAMRKYGSTSYLLAVGDSLTYNTSYGQTRRDFHPARLETSLRAGGKRYDSVNKGNSGDTTAQMIARLAGAIEPGAGSVAVIYAGANDAAAASTVQAAPAPTASTFAVGAGLGIHYGVGGQITVNGVACTVASVATDTITLTAPLGFTPTAGQAVVIDTQANIVTLGNALRAAGYAQLIVGGMHYWNFASGGDTLATPLAANVTLRGLQSAAATSLGALYVDFYAYMRALIVAGTYTQGADTAWHVSTGNMHLNNTGEQIVADAMYAAMQAQGWA